MKRILLLSIIPAAIGFGLWNCGGGGSKEPDAASFTNPDGSVTADNATQVQNDALSAANQDSAFALLGPLLGAKLSPRTSEALQRALSSNPRTSKIRLQGDIAQCIDVNSDGTEGTIDLDCVQTQEQGYGGCTVGGKIGFKFTLNSDKTEIQDLEITVTNIKIACAEGTIESCNGKIKSKDSTNGTVSCANITCDVNGESNTVNGCFLGDDVLVDGDGGNVVCRSVTPNADCSQITAQWSDKDGDATLTCDVTTKDAAVCPPDATGISEVSNCTVTRN